VLLGLAFLAFISLGLPDGVLGVAWPSLRRTFAAPLSHLGILLAVATVGYLASSFSSGWLVARLGLGRLLVWSGTLTAASALGYALAPAWAIVVAGAALAGLGAGAIDAGINAFAAIRFSARTLTWLHASYGLGAMLGPLLMTSILARGLAWRWGYGLIGAGLAALSVGFWLSADRWAREERATRRAGAGPAPPGASLRTALGDPLVWMHMALFGVYTGLEVTVGQWTYSLLTEARGVEAAVAGGWLSAFWSSLVVGRVFGGFLSRGVPADSLLRISLGLVPAGALLLWSDPGRSGTLAALLVLGLAFAPVFPLLISETPRRLGHAGASHAIGFQVAAAYCGTAALPGAAGLLARRHGLEVLGPLLVVASVGLLLLHELALRSATRAGRGVAPDLVRDVARGRWAGHGACAKGRRAGSPVRP
jgi:fucose permease